MIRRFTSILWAIALLFTLIEAKQLKEFFANAIWPYPEYGILLVISFIYLILGRYSRQIDRRYFELFFVFYSFATVYILCSLINAAVAPQVAQGEMLNGLGRVILQYVVAPPLLLISLHAVFGERRELALRSFVLPSILELLLLIGGDVAFAVSVPSRWIAEIRKEVLLQSWVEVGSKVFFIPKWGGTFAESQELGFLMLISLLLLELWLHRARVSGTKWKILWLCYMAAIILTASKGVLAGLFIYLIFRNRKHIQHKIVVLLLIAVPMVIFFYFRISLHHDRFLSEAFSYASLDERLFHIFYYFKLSAANPVHLLIGLGARQYGSLVSKAYPAVFNKNTNAVSIFSIITDSGILGALFYVAIIGYIAKSVGSYLPRLVIISGFVATLWMPDWSMDCYVFFLIIVFYSTLRGVAEPMHECREISVGAVQ